MKTSGHLAALVSEARQRTFDWVADLTDEQLFGPHLAIINPLLWEIGHVAWFQEKWVLRHLHRRPSRRQDSDLLYDSAAVFHDTRWDLPLPTRADTLEYMTAVRDGVLKLLERAEPSPETVYFVLLTVFHEDMHDEAITTTRQTLGYPAPPRSLALSALHGPGADGPPPRGDVEVPGGRFLLGATPDEPFVFDNEKWAHPVEIRPFRIARAPVTQTEFAAFVAEGGYRRRKFWSEKGWHWRNAVAAEHPVYWRKDAGGWQRRHFDQWLALEPHRPMVHVNWYEAEAFCAYAGRRLPTEAEWEMAAAGEPDGTRARLSETKRRFPWGPQPPSERHANMNWRAPGAVDVGARAEGDSAWGCRQMIGNIWEWTSSDFLPYPGFVRDPYKEYSEPWFGTHKVLRGGSWATTSRLIRNTWRNFYTAERQDIFAGFRTCALDD